MSFVYCERYFICRLHSTWLSIFFFLNELSKFQYVELFYYHFRWVVMRGNHPSSRLLDSTLFFSFRVIPESITAQGWIAWTSQHMQPYVPTHLQNLFLSLFHREDRQGLPRWILFRYDFIIKLRRQVIFRLYNSNIFYLLFLWNKVCGIRRASAAVSECVRGRLADGPLSDHWPESPTYVAIWHWVASCRFEWPG